jgi:negative regulator of flagellin synthesis FlgM
MKIDGTTSSPITGVTSSGASARGNKTAPQGRASSGVEKDSVTLSSASSQIQALAAGISEASSFDAAKVESIKQAISDGKFSINPELIADKLIASARELVSQQRG